MLVVGMGNHYGDLDVSPTMIPVAHDFVPGDDPRLPPAPIRTLATPERMSRFPAVREWRYVSKTVTLPRGDHVLYLARVDRRGEERIPLIVRLDHADLPGGRVEHEAWVAVPTLPDPENDVPPTS